MIIRWKLYFLLFPEYHMCMMILKNRSLWYVAFILALFKFLIDGNDSTKLRYCYEIFESGDYG